MSEAKSSSAGYLILKPEGNWHILPSSSTEDLLLTFLWTHTPKIDSGKKDSLFFRPDAFVLDEDMRIPMQMTEAIALGVLDTQTVENIQAFPTVSRNPNWTFWHQLKRFFSHYTRGTDAPMRWDDDALGFWMPPVLHPSIKRLLLISPTLSKRQLHQVFPSEKN